MIGWPWVCLDPRIQKQINNPPAPLHAPNESKRTKDNQGSSLRLRPDALADCLLDTVVLVVGGVGHLPQLVFFGEFTGENTQILDKSLACVDDSVTRSDHSIGLNAQQEVGGQGVRNLAASVSISEPTKRKAYEHPYLVCSEDDIGGLQKTSTEHVAKGMVFLMEGENGRGGKAWDPCQ